MKHTFPARQLRENPDIVQLKRLAKELLKGFLGGEPDSVAEVNAYYRDADPAHFALHDAQLVLARSHGFESWPKMKAHVDGINVHRLAELVQAGDMDRVRQMLKARPELANREMSYGDERRPLHFAVMHRMPEMVRLLMRHGAEARRGVHPRRSATTALRMATERGFDDIVAIIEEEEKRQGVVDPNQFAKLAEAISEGDELHCIEILEADSSLIRQSELNGRTTLHLAAAASRPMLVRWLLRHDADLNRRDKKGLTALDLAGSDEVAELLRKAGVALTLRAAVASGDSAWLRARQAEWTLNNPVTWEDGGLLAVAAKHNRPDILQMLLEFGFDPDERATYVEGDGRFYSQGYALWHCAAEGKLEMAEMLLKYGASMSGHVDSSGSPMHSAYSHRQWEMVELFRRYGGVVSADTAALYRQTDMAKQMLADEDRGALPEGTVSPTKKLAEELLEFAAYGGAPDIVRMAIARIDWKRDDPLWFRYLVRTMDFCHHSPWGQPENAGLDRTTYLECFRIVLERCDPNVVGGFGRTALHEVAAMDDYISDDESAAFATALLEAGARTDFRDDLFYSTPLGWACRWGRESVARVLLAHGVDPIECDAEAWTRPAEWARKMGHASLLEMIRQAENGGRE